MTNLCSVALLIISFIWYLRGENVIFPPNHDADLDWNIRAQVLSERGNDLLSELFDDMNNFEIEILASYETWSESPLYVDSINSILFSSPSDGNLYRYNLGKKETTLFIENAGIFGGNYDSDDIPFDQCLECGPNGMSIGLNGMADYVILNQLALKRIIAFNPTNIDENNIKIIADNLGGIQLNSPNDITITNDGKSIYFTDPTFGLQKEGDTGFLDSFQRSKLGFQGVYRVDAADINSNGNTEAILVSDDMPGPNGLAVTNDNKYLIVSNTGDENGWAPFWNIYKINKSKKIKYTLQKTINFNMGLLSLNLWNVPVPLTDGMEIYNDNILLAICPNGICLIDLKQFKIAARITIDHLISNINIYNGYIYVTALNNLFRIKLNN